jgi:hypothetical protein
MDLAGDRLHRRLRVTGPAQVSCLRVLLWGLGHGLVLASRFSAPIRSQITRSLTVEISTDDGVARHWVFDGQRRQVAVFAGRAKAPDFAIRFSSSGQALAYLTSARAIDRILGGVTQGAVRLEGSPMVLVWFHGLAWRLVTIGRAGPPRHALPGAYLAHDPASNGVEQIAVEPAVGQLDPHWTGAWNARTRLWIVRGASGDPLREP